MKKTGIIVLLAGSCFFFSNCHQKAFPVASDNKKQVVENKQVAVAAQKNAGFTDEQRAHGKTIYESECGKCHGLPNPGEYNLQAWNDILPRMVTKSRLADDKSVLVRAYVNANAKAS